MEVKRDKEEGKTISNKLAKMSIEENDPLAREGEESRRRRKIRGEIGRSIWRDRKGWKEESLREDRSMNTSRRSLGPSGRLSSSWNTTRVISEGGRRRKERTPSPLDLNTLHYNTTLFESRWIDDFTFHVWYKWWCNSSSSSFSFEKSFEKREVLRNEKRTEIHFH